MFTVNSYLLAVIFCIVTMICWGSWGNTQKLQNRKFDWLTPEINTDFG